MKKVKILLLMVFFLVFSAFSSKVFADTNNLTSSDLIRIYDPNGTFDYTVRSNTTIDQLKMAFGEPKLTTDSVFGGHAYTFYTDDDYSNYLYVETVAGDEYIMSYGTVWSGYQIYGLQYGDEYQYLDTSHLQGKTFQQGGLVRGGVYYNRNKYIGGSASSTISTFESNYENNSVHYLKGIAQQSILMFRALLHLNGYSCNFDFDEDYFYINEQLKENGLPMREYLNKINKSNYKETIGTRLNYTLNSKNYYLLSPAIFCDFYFQDGSVRKNYTGSKTIAVFDYDKNNALLTAIIVDPTAFVDYGSAEMTIEENNKYRAGKAEYERAMNYLSMDSDLYSVNPVISPASGLVAGDLLANKKAGILCYYNAIRAAAGLPTLTQGTENATTAQYMATLTSYRWNSLGLEIMHNPPQPSGVSQSFYRTAIGYGKSFAENVSRSNMSSSAETMTRFVNMFIDDRTESPLRLSHRSLLLNPTFENFGFGISPNIGVIELNGSRNTDVFLKAWPAEGITFMESLDGNPFYWSAQFIDKYTFKSNSMVTVKCLNTGSRWVFANEESTSSRKYEIVTNAQQELRNMVIFYDNSLIPQAEYVYEITLDNLTDNSTGANTSYKYRAVFQYADDGKTPVLATNIKINTEKVKAVSGEENVYFVPINEEAKFGVNFASGVDNKKVTWYSDSQDVTVTQNGTVVAKKKLDNDAKITVVYDATGAEDYVYVRPYVKVDQVKLSETSIELQENSSVEKTIYIKTIPDEADEILQIDWVVVQENISTTEYAYNSSQISKSLEITKIDDRTIKVKAKTIEPGNYKFKIIAKVKGLSADFTGSCIVNVEVPLEIMQFSPNNAYDKDIVEITNGTLTTPSYTKINFNKFYEYNKTDVIRFKALFKPNNTTVRQECTWKILTNNNVISEYAEAGSFRVNKPGISLIQITSVDEPKMSVKLRIQIECTLTDINITTPNNQKVYLDENEDGTYSATKQIEVSKVPSIANNPLIYKSSNTSIATVDENGLVTFKKAGNVTITVSALDGEIQKTVNLTGAIAATKLDIDENPEVLFKNGTITRTAKALPSAANVDNYITYTSSNTKVATVTSKGVVKAVGYGEATITVKLSALRTGTGEDLIKTYTVYVINPVTEATLIGPDNIILENGNANYGVSLLPIDHHDDINVRWSVSNSSIATIDHNGVLTPKEIGYTKVKAEITATSTPLDSNIFVVEKELCIDSRYEQAYKKGDINRDGKVNAEDAAIAIELFKTQSWTPLQLKYGDMDDNRVINAEDAALIIEVFKTSK